MQLNMKGKIGPMILALGIIALDQVSKAIIVAVSGNQTGILANFFGDLLYVTHQRNLGAAFSLADGLPGPARILGLIAIPVIVLLCLLAYTVKSKDFTTLQVWAIFAIIGGGFGNIIDRAFRPLGVVDFISVKFFGLFGLERWPTFNVADSAVVVGGIVLLISFIAQICAGDKAAKGETK
jgi:signal peptidase II